MRVFPMSLNKYRVQRVIGYSVINVISVISVVDECYYLWCSRVMTGR